MSKKKIPQRAGAAALAAATVVSGLAFGPGAVAAPVQSTGSTPVVLPAAEDPRHVVGPLVLQTGASQYTGVFGNTENHPRNGSFYSTLAEARGEATNWSMPAFDGKGEIRSLDRDECIETYGPDQYGVYLRPCTGAANQQWSWIDAHNPFGANTKTLVADSNPQRAMLNRNQTGGTYLVNRPIAESKPFVLDDAMVETRALSASASGHLDSTTVTISGVATPGSTVSAAGASGVAASDGRFSFDVPGVEGPQRIRVTETLSNGVVWGETDVDAVPGADFGSMSPVEAPSKALTRGDDTTVQAFLSIASRVTSITSKVTFTAPSGTTFSESDDGSVQYKKPGSSEWITSVYAPMSGRVVSDDRKTVTYDLGTRSGFDLPEGSQLRFNAVISAPDDALDQEDLALGLTLAGTTNTGTFRVTTSAPVSIPGDFGSISPVEVPSTELLRGGESTVHGVVSTGAAISSIDSKMSLTAPAGTTFANADDRAVSFKQPGASQWSDSAYLRLTEGVLSDDKTTVTYKASANHAWFSLPAGSQLRFGAVIDTPAGLADSGGLALSFRHSGSTDSGAFTASGTAPVSIPGDFGPMAPVEMAPVEIARGADSEVTFETKVAADALRLPVTEVTLTAPAGTTFAEGQDEITGAFIRNGSPDPTGMQLTGGVRSDDGRTYTYTWDTAANGVPQWQSPRDEVLRWKIAVSTPERAPETENNSLAYQFTGTSVQGAFRATGVAPVVMTGDFGPMAPVEMAPVEIARGSDSEVTFETKVAADALRLPVTKITLTAPAGTTFAEGQDEITGAFIRDGQEYRAGMQLTGGVRSDDGRTYTFTWDTAANGVPVWQSPRDEVLRWKIAVSTPERAPETENNSLGYQFTGTSVQGAFRATGVAPVVMTGDFGPLAPVEVPSVELTRGERADVSFIVETAAELTSVDSTLVLTAPEGTTFADAGDRPVSYLLPGTSDWRQSAFFGLRDGVLSDDAKQLTFEADTMESGFRLAAGSRLEFSVAVQTPADAVETADAGLGFLHEGTSNGGAFRATGAAPVSFVDAYTDVSLDSFSDGDTFTPGDVVFSGTGTPGASVTVAPAVGASVSTEVREDGTWSVVRYLGNANYVMSVSQVAASGENTISGIRLFSDQVAALDFAVTSPVSGAGHTQQGWVTFTGTGTTWSTVSIADGTGVAPTTATIQYDGSWTARRWVGTEKTTFTVTSARAGVENGSQSIEFNTGVSGREFTLDSHADGGTFTPGNVVFRGTGSTGDKVTFTAPGLAPLEATVNAAGEWSIPRWLGNGQITFTVIHAPVVGEQTQQTLRLYSDQVASGPFVLTSPVDGSGHERPGWVTFTGTGTTWSTVSVSDGTAAAPSTATVQYDGSWTVNRWVGTNPVTFTVTSARGGVENGRETVEFNVGDVVGDFSFDSHADGGTFTPGNVVFSGKGSTGDKVTMTAAGLAPLEAEVDSRGNWSIQRWLGNGSITFEVVHTPLVGEETKKTLRLFSDQVPQGELVVTSPIDGASHDQAGYVTFTGTGTTWSRVSISDGSNAAPSTANVQYDGSWSVRRWVGTDPVTFTVTSERADIANGNQTIRFNTAE